MTVEKFMVNGEKIDDYPVGLRVLAVDDDPICLKLLETLLRKCQYHVTTTNQARMALKMLRGNKELFDLVISDVHMPDMDGFKLLELVGLEMDLPVIMLSANGDPKLVFKGVTHGACDYLVKPVRLEELRNIWQHVIRRKKIDPKGKTKSNEHIKASQSSGEDHSFPFRSNSNLNGTKNRKRKEDEEESEDNENSSDDPATQKKPRVVWSIDLHKKFVGAVNQLGIEKAVPKSILDLMNEDGLTRENVASHLQKYRFYLKRISSVAAQQADMAASLGIKDSPFNYIGSFKGLGDVRGLAGSGRLGSSAISPYTNGGMFERLNTPANIGLHNLTPSNLTQPNHAHSITSLSKILPGLPSTIQSSSLYQGYLSLDQLQTYKTAPGIVSIHSMDNSRIYAASNVFNSQGEATGTSNSILNGAPTNSMMHSLNGTGFISHSSLNMAAFNPESFNAGGGSSLNLLDHVAVESSRMQPNSLLSGDPFDAQLPMNIKRDNGFSSRPYLQTNPMGLPSASTALPLDDSGKMHFHEGLVDHLRNTAHLKNQRWGEQALNYTHGSSIAVGSLNSQGSGMLNQQKGGLFMDESSPNLVQQNENGGMARESTTMNNDTFFWWQPKLHGEFVSRGYDSLDDVMNAMIKRLSWLPSVVYWCFLAVQEHDEGMPSCDSGFDDYSFGADS